MDDDTTAAAAAPERTTRHVPHDVVREILIRLPVRSLLRFTGVCKAWSSTISDDPSFSRAQLRHKKDDHPCLLIAPQRGAYMRQDRVTVATAGLYRWRENHVDAVLVHPMDSLRSEFVRPLAHCDGLVLVGTTSAVRVLNPATGSVLKLPQSLAGPAASCYTYQAFGLGRDPRTEAYKVARLYEPSFVERNKPLHMEMEVFTIGVDQHWHETERPQYRITRRQTATFFKGSLLWTIDDNESVPAYLRFSLEDEAFSTIPSPPYRRPLAGHRESMLSELRGELCVASRHNHRAIDIWMCADIQANTPRWDKRYTIRRDRPRSSLRPVAVLGGGVLVCQTSGNRLCSCDLQTQKRVVVKDSFAMNDMFYYNIREGSYFELSRRRLGSYFDVIPYVPSLIGLDPVKLKPANSSQETPDKW